MSRIKTFCKYILLLVGFYILSNILIFFGINTSYNNLSIKDSIPEQVHITDASATLVNGRVKGYLSNIDYISDIYLQFNFYNDTDSLAGTKYIKISELKDKEFNFYFKLHYIDSYSVTIVSETQDIDAFEEFFSYEEYRKYKIVYWFLLLAFI